MCSNLCVYYLAHLLVTGRKSTKYLYGIFPEWPNQWNMYMTVCLWQSRCKAPCFSHDKSKTHTIALSLSSPLDMTRPVAWFRTLSHKVVCSQADTFSTTKIPKPVSNEHPVHKPEWLLVPWQHSHCPVSICNKHLRPLPLQILRRLVKRAIGRV